jgi:hypothetical protein
LVVIPYRNIRQKPGNEQLDADQDEENTHKRPDTLSKRCTKDQLFNQHPKKDSATQSNQSHPGAPKKMQWPMRILSPKPDGNHVDETLHAPFPVVFGHPVYTRMMTHLDFSHSETLELKQCWNETVHFAEKIDVSETLLPVSLQAASGIMDIVMDEHLSKEVRDTGWDLLTPRIMPLMPPPRNDVEPFFDFRKQKRDISRIVLKVPIQSDDDCALRFLDSGIKSSCLSEVLPKNDQGHRLTTLRFDARTIPRSIVNENDFERLPDLLEGCADFPVKDFDVPFFVIQRNHYREIRSFSHISLIGLKNMGTHHTVPAVYREAESGATGNQLPPFQVSEKSVYWRYARKQAFFSLIPKIMKKATPLKDMALSQENQLLSVLSLLLGINALFFIAPHTASLTLLRLTQDNLLFYEGFTFLGVMLVGTIFYYNRLSSWHAILRKLLLTTFPAWFFITYGLMESKSFHYLFQIAQSAYMMLFGFLIAALSLPRLRTPDDSPRSSDSVRGWFRHQGTVTLLLVCVGTLIFLSFGLVGLTKFAAVDEPLWYNNRIAKYWKNIGEHDWKGTSISDKPGITLAWATGPGLWFKTPKEYKSIRYEGEVYSANQDSIENFYLAFRLPLLLVITLSLPLFYFFIERLLGRTTALFSYAFLSTSPVLIGISKIINPDALLWIFAPLSILSYLLFLNRRFFRYLILSGIFLGLALLTKYVANIILIFFISLIFLEYLYHRPINEPFSAFLKRSFAELGILIYAALATFYILFPAVWIKPMKLLTATIYSQAFEKVTPLLLMFLALILIDHLANRARITDTITTFLDRFKRSLAVGIVSFFLISLIATLMITWRGMHPYDFSELLASPKTIEGRSDFIGVFLTNFYPLVFGIPPISLLLLLIAPFMFLKRSFSTSPSNRTALYLILFVLLYYLGATVNSVAMITRYQIILFPITALLAGITLTRLLKTSGIRFPLLSSSVPIAIAGCILLTGSLTLSATPFPLSYASSLLPNSYHTNIKDMGSGSYEAAQYLNTLPNAEQLLIWTDKDGVCKFFVGHCKRGRNYQALRQDGLDYIVVSSDRKNRTTKMMASEITLQKPGLIRFDQYYTKPSPSFELNINDRPSQYVRVYRFQE